ncbi:MAG: cation transporter [Chlorobi bacterium]|nr:cation transporter [Chlorobiota bacterium]
MSEGSKRVIIAAFLANLGIALAKFIASFISGSSAMLAEAVHSMADTANQLFLFIGLKRAKKPPTSLHPFGFGQERYFWTFVVAMSLFVIGGTFSVYEGIAKAIHPHQLENIAVSYVVLGVSLVLEGLSFRTAWKEFALRRGAIPTLTFIRQTKDPVLITVLFEDASALLGLLIALSGITLSHVTGELFFDGLASVLIGILLILVAVFLAWESKSLLIGESASPENIERIRKAVDDTDGIERVGELLTMHLGPDQILVNLSLDFADNLSAEEIERTTAELERRIRETVPGATRIFIEAKNLHTPRRSPRGQ